MPLLLLTYSSLTVSVLFKHSDCTCHAECSCPQSALTTYQSHYFKFYVGCSWVEVCVLNGVNIHQEATYVCTGDHQLWNNSVLPSPSPAGFPCDKAEMEVCCRSEWGCNYFLTSLSASKPSHSALRLMRCPCGIVMLSKWMPLWQPRA